MPRRPAPRSQSSSASAISSDAAETAATTPHRVALHGIQASVAWAVTYVLVHRAAWLKVGMEARTRRCGTLSILSLTLILQRVRVCHAVIWLCVPSDACAVCARATRAISIFRSRHHLGLAGRLRMHVLMGGVCCELLTPRLLSRFFYCTNALLSSCRIFLSYLIRSESFSLAHNPWPKSDGF